MAGVSNKPFLEYQLELLKENQITELVLCVGYLKERIQNHFANGEDWGVKIDYAIEKNLLGTGGAIKNAEAFINAPFLVINGDTFLDINLRELTLFHQKAKANTDNLLGTVVLTEVADPTDYGRVELSNKGHILAFNEKAGTRPLRSWVNAGFYLFEPDILELIPQSRRLSLEKEILPSVLQSHFNLLGFTSKGFFVDIGTPHGLSNFKNYVKEKMS